MHETINPIASLPITITRISYDPDIFLVRNFLSSPVEQIDMIRAAVSNGMEYSGTSSGDVVSQRFKSYTSWIYPNNGDDNADNGDSDVDSRSVDNTDDEVDRNGRLTAQFMTELAAHLFFPEPLIADEDSSGSGVFSSEAVQGKCSKKEPTYRGMITCFCLLMFSWRCMNNLEGKRREEIHSN